MKKTTNQQSLVMSNVSTADFQSLEGVAISEIKVNDVPNGTTAHYQIPNLSNMLYEYTNKEREIVE